MTAPSSICTPVAGLGRQECAALLFRGLSGAGHALFLLPLCIAAGKRFHQHSWERSAALARAGTTSHLLLCACITAPQADTSEKRAISQSSDWETLRSRRARREVVMGEGSTRGRLLQDWKARRKTWRGRFCCLPLTVLLLPVALSCQGPPVHPRAGSECRTCLREIRGKNNGWV